MQILTVPVAWVGCGGQREGEETREEIVKNIFGVFTTNHFLKGNVW